MVEKRAKSDKMKTQMVHNNFFQKGDMVVNGKGGSLEKGGYLTLFQFVVIKGLTPVPKPVGKIS